MKAWNVYLDGELIDIVFYDDSCDADEVKAGLINQGILLSWLYSMTLGMSSTVNVWSCHLSVSCAVT